MSQNILHKRERWTTCQSKKRHPLNCQRMEQASRRQNHSCMPLEARSHTSKEAKHTLLSTVMVSVPWSRSDSLELHLEVKSDTSAFIMKHWVCCHVSIFKFGFKSMAETLLFVIVFAARVARQTSSRMPWRCLRIWTIPNEQVLETILVHDETFRMFFRMMPSFGWGNALLWQPARVVHSLLKCWIP